MVRNRWDLANITARLTKEIRMDAGLSQKRLADILDCDHTYISHIEAGRKIPSLDFLLGLAAVGEKSLTLTMETIH